MMTLVVLELISKNNQNLLLLWLIQPLSTIWIWSLVQLWHIIALKDENMYENFKYNYDFHVSLLIVLFHGEYLLLLPFKKKSTSFTVNIYFFYSVCSLFDFKYLLLLQVPRLFSRWFLKDASFYINIKIHHGFEKHV